MVEKSTKAVMFAVTIAYLTTFATFFFNMSTWTTKTNTYGNNCNLIVNCAKVLASSQSTFDADFFMQDML